MTKRRSDHNKGTNLPNLQPSGRLRIGVDSPRICGADCRLVRTLRPLNDPRSGSQVDLEDRSKNLWHRSACHVSLRLR